MRVLVVEDNPVNRRLACRYLERLRVDSVTAEDGVQALAALDADRFDAVLMDCQMPVLDGYGATRELRRREVATGAAPTVVVALTANTSVDDRRACIDAGMDDHLEKPYTQRQLAEILARWRREGARVVRVPHGGRGQPPWGMHAEDYARRIGVDLETLAAGAS